MARRLAEVFTTPPAPNRDRGRGYGNLALADYATIAGGGLIIPRDYTTGNRVSDNDGTIGGGGNNRAGNNAGTTADQPVAAALQLADWERTSLAYPACSLAYRSDRSETTHNASSRSSGEEALPAAPHPGDPPTLVAPHLALVEAPLSWLTLGDEATG